MVQKYGSFCPSGEGLSYVVRAVIEGLVYRLGVLLVGSSE